MCFLPIKYANSFIEPSYSLIGLYFRFILDKDNKVTGAYFIISNALDKEYHSISFQHNQLGFNYAFKELLARLLALCRKYRRTKACIYVRDLARSPFNHSHIFFLNTLRALTKEDCTFNFRVFATDGKLTTNEIIIEFTHKPDEKSKRKFDKKYILKFRGFKQSFKTDIYSDPANIPPIPTTLDETKEHAEKESFQLSLSLSKTMTFLRDNFAKDIKHPYSGKKVSAIPPVYYNASIGSLAKQHYLFNEYYGMSQLRKIFFAAPIFLRTERFFRNALRGGLLGVYKPVIGKGFFYDINSLYSYVLQNFPMPTMEPEFIQKVDFNSDFFGFVEAKVHSPSNIYIPVLPFKDPNYNHKSTFPNGTFKTTFFSEELKYAQTLGVKIIETYSGYKFQSHIMFHKTMTHLIKVKNKYREYPLEHKLAKIMANTLYGSFATNTENIYSLSLNNDTFFIGNKFLDPQEPDVPYDIDELHPEKAEKKLEAFVYFQQTKSLPISAATAAYARVYLHRIISQLKCNIYYIDTDAIVVDKPLPKEYLCNRTPGKFKLVTNIDKGIFLAPKCYICVDKKGNKKIAFSGLSTFQSSTLVYEDFLKMYKDKELVMKKENKTSVIFKFYNKSNFGRVPIFDNNGLCINTQAIVIDQE